jgi:hypothetical protein
MHARTPAGICLCKFLWVGAKSNGGFQFTNSKLKSLLLSKYKQYDSNPCLGRRIVCSIHFLKGRSYILCDSDFANQNRPIHRIARIRW